MFTPNLIEKYTEGRNDLVRDGIKFAMKYNSLVFMVPLAGFFVYGKNFISLWQTALDADKVNTVYTLAVLVFVPMISSVITQPLLLVNTITALLRWPVIINIIIGVGNVGLCITLIKTTSLGVFAIAGSSAFLLLLRNFIFYPMYSARNLGFSKRTFYPVILRSLACFVAITVFLYGTHYFLTIDSWLKMIGFAALFGIIAELILFLLILNKEDKNSVIDILKKKLRRKKRNGN